MTVKYSRKAITQLNKMYKSVLVKCFMINCGLFVSISQANASYNSLAEAVADTTTLREYTLTDNETVSAGLGTMGGTSATLTIDGSANKYGINADEVSGITVGEGNSLILKNLGSVTVSGEGDSVADYVINSSVNGFKSNGYGGFINNSGILTVKDSVFSDNTAPHGAVINNSGTYADISEITNAIFYGNQFSENGGAINNTSGASIGNINANFVNNTGDDLHLLGGAIYNDNGSIGDISGKFLGNTSTATYWVRGGSIFNDAGSTIQNVSSDFTDNSVTAAYVYGGNIYNRSSTMGNITGNFKNNTVTTTVPAYAIHGGLVYNYNASIANISGNFEDNTVTTPDTQLVGALINNAYSSIGNISGDFKNNTAKSTSNNVFGLINNQLYSSIGNISGNFENNTMEGKNVYGIIMNSTSVENITGDFKNNTLSGNTVYGGIMNNGGTIKKIEGVTFENNKAEGSNIAIGAALTNINGVITNGIVNSKFLNNATIAPATDGAAIYTSQSLNIIADGSIGDGVSTFKGNYIKYGDTVENEAIFVANASKNLTFNAKNDGVINMYDFINGVSGYKTDITGDSTGTMNLYNDIKDSNVSVDNITVNIDNSQIETGSIVFGSNSTLNLAVNSLADHGKVTADEITVDGGAKLNVTLAKGIVKFNQKATIQLLEAENTNFNNFADSFDNKMYHFQKDGRDGAYSISMSKSAADVSREAGGSQTEIEAAAAWVDGADFKPGSKSAEVAEKLNTLAQDDGKAFNRALSSVAPAPLPSSSTIMTTLTDRLMLTVDNRLSTGKVTGMSSGDDVVLNGYNLWAKAYQGESKLNNYFDADNRGIIAGMDRKITPEYTLGFGFQYDENDIDTSNREIYIKTASGFVYGQYKPSQWFINATASYGKSYYHENRHALDMKIRDKFSSDIYSLQALSGYEFKYVTPEIGARYYFIKRHGHQDSVGQDIAAEKMDVLRGVLGLRSSYEIGIFKPEVYAGIVYDFVRDNEEAVVSLPNNTRYTVYAKHMKRFGYEFNAGTSAQLADNLSAYIGYEGKYREHYQDHAGILNFKYSF